MMPLLQLTKPPALYAVNQRGCHTPQSRFGRPGDVVIMTFCHPKWRFRKRKKVWMRWSITGINKYSEIGNVSAVKMESVIQ